VTGSLLNKNISRNYRKEVQTLLYIFPKPITAPPNNFSPTAAALASFVNATGMAICLWSNFANGIIPFRERFTAFSIVPLLGFPLGAATPIAFSV
jgi:ABC-type transporter Mla subunit MlaD